MNLFIHTLFQDPVYYFSWIGVVAFSICVHEYAHAATAYRFGDDTAALLGHLSLNPAVQMGPTSLVMLALIGIAWGQVPVNEGRLRGRLQRTLVAAAGPISNLALSMLFALVSVVLSLMRLEGEAADIIQRLFLIGALVNGVLFVLNMLPVPILDGWKVYAHFVPPMRYMNPQMANQISWFVLIAIFVTPFGAVIWKGGGAISEMFFRFWHMLLSPLFGSFS
ncbi:MAG: site-2 protease family protein [Verrucomicrobia bacterium]|nr:site-2 protease family protein [Verrucomicrobiota bacterium]